MNAQQICRQCGMVLSRNTMQGLCPRCVGKLAFDSLLKDDQRALEVISEFGPEPVLFRFGDYDLLEQVAHGGMGIVYRARQISLNRIVAVKMILLGRFASQEQRRRFHAEAEAVARLQHPHIVSIHEIGEVNGQPFFSMDYVVGRQLDELVKAQPLAPRRAAQYARKIAQAVHYAHQHGIVHRDLKPSNILIDQEEQPWITDFGLAKCFRKDSDLTLTGQVLGSPSFLPPEQAGGKMKTAGPHSDIYSIGAILYFLLTGRPPFLSESLEQTLQQVLWENPVSLRLLNRSVPKDLETICLKSLEKEPHRRYETAEQLAEELRRFEEGKPIVARPLNGAHRLWRWCRQNPGTAGSAACALLVFLVGLTGVLWQWQRAQHLALQESVQRERAERALVDLEIQHAEEMLAQNETSEGLAYLAHVLRKNPHHFSVAERILSVLNHRSFALPLTHPMQHAAAVNEAVFSPDGRWIATASSDHTARIWDRTTAEPVGPALQHGDEVHAVDFSPDGTQVATASEDRTVRIWLAASGEPVAGAFPHAAPVQAVAFHPVRPWILTATKTGIVTMWDIESSKPIHQNLSVHPGEVSSARFSSDGKFIGRICGTSSTGFHRCNGLGRSGRLFVRVAGERNRFYPQPGSHGIRQPKSVRPGAWGSRCLGVSLSNSVRHGITRAGAVVSTQCPAKVPF